MVTMFRGENQNCRDNHKNYISLANLMGTDFEINSVIYGCFIKFSPRAIRVFRRRVEVNI